MTSHFGSRVLSIVSLTVIATALRSVGSSFSAFVNIASIFRRNKPYMQAMRDITTGTNLTQLDVVASDIVNIGKEYGVSFNGELHNKIIMQNGSFSTTVGVFDDNIPFAQRGLGSKRLLSMGMNINAFEQGTLSVAGNTPQCNKRFFLGKQENKNHHDKQRSAERHPAHHRGA